MPKAETLRADINSMDLTPAKTSLPLVHPRSRIMRAPWTPKGVRGLTVMNPVLIGLLGMALSSFGVHSVLVSEDMGTFLKLFLITLNIIATVFILAQVSSLRATFSSPDPEKTEVRNRELLDLVSKGTDWSPHSLALILIGSKQGEVDLYEGSAKEAESRLQEWFRSVFVSSGVDCRNGHQAICVHRTPDIYRWMNGEEPIHKTS